MPSNTIRFDNTSHQDQIQFISSSMFIKPESLSTFDLFDQDDIDTLGLADSGLESIDMNKSFIYECSMDGTTHQSSPNSLPHPTEAMSRINAFRCMATSHQEVEEEEEHQQQDESVIMEKPKRSLTAYNFFFQDERKRLLKVLPVQKGKKSNRKVHGKLTFTEMARTVAASWKKISPEAKMEYEYRSELDKERFERENSAWKRYQSAGNVRKNSTNRKQNGNTNAMRGFSSEPMMQSQVPVLQSSNSNFQWQEYQEEGNTVARNMFFS